MFFPLWASSLPILQYYSLVPFLTISPFHFRNRPLQLHCLLVPFIRLVEMPYYYISVLSSYQSKILSIFQFFSPISFTAIHHYLAVLLFPSSLALIDLPIPVSFAKILLALFSPHDVSSSPVVFYLPFWPSSIPVLYYNIPVFYVSFHFSPFSPV